MEQTLNYGIIVFDSIRIEGEITFWEYMSCNNTVNLVLNGVRYKVDASNVLLMHKDEI